jgi:hypothetical protein
MSPAAAATRRHSWALDIRASSSATCEAYAQFATRQGRRRRPCVALSFSAKEENHCGGSWPSHTRPSGWANPAQQLRPQRGWDAALASHSLHWAGAMRARSFVLDRTAEGLPAQHGGAAAICAATRRVASGDGNRPFAPRRAGQSAGGKSSLSTSASCDPTSCRRRCSKRAGNLDECCYIAVPAKWYRDDSQLAMSFRSGRAEDGPQK